MRRRMMRGRRRVYRRRYSKRARWQVRARRQVGNPKNYSTSKTTESVLPGLVTTLATKTISPRQLILISGTSSNSISGRQRDMCVISGIKIDLTFKNLLTVRQYVNWAVIHPKQGQTVTQTQTDFFRDYTSERAFNADAVTVKTGLTYSVAQINTDEYVVMKRGKFMLTPFGNEAQNGLYNYAGNTKEKSIYCKLGRSFYFDDGSASPQDQVWFVCWGANPDEGVTTTPSALSYRLRSVVYWREPRGA